MVVYQAHAEVLFWQLHALPRCFSHRRLFCVPCLQGTLYILLYAIILTDCLLQALTERTANVSSALLTNQRLAWEFVGRQAVASSFSVWVSQVPREEEVCLCNVPMRKSKSSLWSQPLRGMPAANSRLQQAAHSSTANFSCAITIIKQK